MTVLPHPDDDTAPEHEDADTTGDPVPENDWTDTDVTTDGADTSAPPS